MAAYVEFESRFAGDRRAADAKLRRVDASSAGSGSRSAQALSLQLLNDVVRDYPGSPQAQQALQTKLRIETDRKDLRAIDPVTKQEVPAVIVTLRTIIEQFPDAPQSLAARNRLAMMLTQMNRHQEAAEVLEDLAAQARRQSDGRVVPPRRDLRAPPERSGQGARKRTRRCRRDRRATTTRSSKVNRK